MLELYFHVQAFSGLTVEFNFDFCMFLKCICNCKLLIISNLLRVISLLQQDGPCLVLFINVGKCEIYSHNHLEGFPEQIVKSNKACFVILGIPIGDAEFCASFISSKHVESKYLLALNLRQ